MRVSPSSGFAITSRGSGYPSGQVRLPKKITKAFGDTIPLMPTKQELLIYELQEIAKRTVDPLARAAILGVVTAIQSASNQGALTTNLSEQDFHHAFHSCLSEVESIPGDEEGSYGELITYVGGLIGKTHERAQMFVDADLP